MTFSYESFQSRDIPAHDRLMRQAFATSAQRNAELRQQTGEGNIRVLRSGHEVAGVLTRIVCGQYLGGKAVPAAFVAGVAVPTHLRNRQLGKQLFLNLFQECQDLDVPLAVLGAAIPSFYRKLGFEFAGSRFTYSADLHKLNPSISALLTVEPVGEAVHYPFPPNSQFQQVEAIYHTTARNNNGLIEREAFFWQERLAPVNQVVDVFLLLNEQQVAEGYLALTHPKSNSLIIRDWGVSTARAAQTILGYLATYQTHWQKAQWFGSYPDLLTYHMSNWGWEILKAEDWMLRIVDLEKALTFRGYPPTLDAQLGLKIEDPYVVKNQGHFVLTIKKGRGSVAKTSQLNGPFIECNIASFSGIFTGYFSSSFLQQNNQVTGNQQGLALAEQIFYGSKPWMQDIF